MKLTCDEASAICDKSQYNEASLWEKIKLKAHLFLCKKCELYAKQNKIMSTCLKKLEEVESHKTQHLNQEEINCMAQELKTKIEL
ncbi:MAG: hypothetical protein A3F91_07735 [Flavobacteria bacterium RIFCSPLOWO2_12_FULL_35_11]|nr:MAG: hypothetical protein A3F91_07735 [Flavobacteria bacterium RIFCSPLOWO2_12_FULL_35_11]